MKKKISISIEESTAATLEKYVLVGGYRNKSHLVEAAINAHIKKVDDD